MLQLKNFAKGNLYADISNSATAFSLNTGQGALFPSIGSSYPFRAVIWGASYITPEQDPDREIVECYRSSADSFTIVTSGRAKESTIAKAWQEGDNFALVLTAETLENNYGAWSRNSTNGYLQLKTTTDKVGIGSIYETVAPAYKLSVYGTTSSDAIQTFMGLEITPVPTPSSPVCTVSAGGSVDVDTWRYYLTYYTASGETVAAVSTTYPVVTVGNQTVTVTISTSTDGRVVGRKLYRYSNTLGTQYLVATIANNTDTSYVDTAAKATLSSANFYFQDNTTTKYITIGGTKAMHLGSYNLAINTWGALVNLTAGGRNTIVGNGSAQTLTSGTNNDIFGYNAAPVITSGYGNTVLSSQALQGTTTGYYNIAAGQNSLMTGNRTMEIGIGIFSGRGAAGCTANNNIWIGHSTGGGSISSASYNIGIGSEAFTSLTSGAYTIAIGYQAAYSLTSNGSGTHLGYRAGRSNTGGGGVYIGKDAGYYETAANKLFIDNAVRANEADGRIKALVYGIFDATTSNQLFRVNGVLESTVDFKLNNVSLKDVSETLTNKTISGASNIISGITEAMLSTSDVTTLDVSTSKHGFVPKAPNDTTKFLRGDGAWAVPTGGGLALVGSDTTERTTTSNSLTDLSSVTGLNISPAVPIKIVFNWRKTSGASAGARFNIKINGSVVSLDTLYGSTTNQNESGCSEIIISPRSTNFLRGLQGWMINTFAGTIVQYGADSDLPSTNITSITIQGKTSTGTSITVATKDLMIYTLPT
ncbi:MAG: hypothetical protein HY959_03700 [Ignavibacteriae bacterium]|nr:hypothetical protein [Ignavibacteriota bacterium]